jgi:hypothetical protein
MGKSKSGQKTESKKPAKQAKNTGKAEVRKHAGAKTPPAHRGDSEVAAIRKKAIQDKADAVRALEHTANRQEIEVRYQMAQHCRDVVEGDGQDKTYGTHAVETFSEKINWSRSQVYAYAKVATTWTAEQVRDLQATWSHLLALVSDKADKHREKLVEKVKADGLSVRGLKQEIARLVPPEPPKKTDYTLDTSPSKSLVEAVQDYSAKLTAFETGGKSDAQRLQQVVKKASREDLTRETLKQFRELKKRLQQAYEHDLAVLDDCITRATAGRDSEPSSPEGKPKPAKPMKAAATSAKPVPTKAGKTRRTAKAKKPRRAKKGTVKPRSIARLPRLSDIHL